MFIVKKILRYAILLFLITVFLSAPVFAAEEHFKTISEAQKAFEAGDFRKGEDILLELKKKYESEAMLISLANVYAELGESLFRSFNYGKSMGYVNDGLKLIFEIEKIGVSNVNDDGIGHQFEYYSKTYGHFGELYAKTYYEDYRKMYFYSAKWRIYQNLSQNYRIAGEYPRAEEFFKKMQEALEVSNKHLKEARFMKNPSELIELSLTEAAKKFPSNKKIYEDQIASFKQTNERLMNEGQKHSDDMAKTTKEISGIYAEITKKIITKDITGLDVLIDDYAKKTASLDSTLWMITLSINSLKTYGQAGMIDDCEKIKDYYIHYALRPWEMVLKAFEYKTVGQPEKSKELIEKAMDIFSKREKISFKTYAGPQYMKLFQISESEKIPLSWQILYASVLADIGDDRAVSLYGDIKNDFSKILQQEKEKLATLGPMVFAKDEILENINTDLSRFYEKKGDSIKTLEYLDGALKLRESARSSFSVESHKIAYLIQNKKLYEKFLNLSTYDSLLNLAAMERAKSRAMVDLIAQRIQDTGEPILKNIAAKKLFALMEMPITSQVEPQTRGIKIIQKDITDAELQALMKNQPEMYSLVSVEPMPPKEIEGIIPEDAAVISYYVMDDSVYINLLQKGNKIVKRVNIPKMSLYGNIYNFRKKIQDKNYKEDTKEESGIDISWAQDNKKVKISIKNNMPFPLEIINITKIVPNYYPPQSIYSLHFIKENQIGIEPLVKLLESSNSKILMEDEISFEWASSYIEEIHLETNIGDFWIKLFLKDYPGGPSITEIGRAGTKFRTDKTGLYDILIKPVEGSISAKHLIIIPHSALHLLPFEALKDSAGKYLIEKYVISYAPSLAVLKFCKTKNSGKKEKLVAYGDPLGDLKFAKTEVSDIKGFFSQSRVVTGQEVTLQNVLDSIKQGDIIHFACHGVFDPSSPFDSSLLLYGEKGNPEPFTVSKVMGLRLNPYLVTLSACDTGLARISGGDELLGLIRGFFIAGTPSLITTLWEIDDKSSNLLVSRFYDNLITKKMDKAQALKEAKLSLMKNGYNRPYYWAAFVLQGDWK